MNTFKCFAKKQIIKKVHIAIIAGWLMFLFNLFWGATVPQFLQSCLLTVDYMTNKAKEIATIYDHINRVLIDAARQGESCLLLASSLCAEMHLLISKQPFFLRNTF